MYQTTLLEKLIIGSIVGLFALLIFGCLTEPKCLHGHYEKVHHTGSTMFMMVGKIMVPIQEPAYDSNDFICDEYCKGK